jgi:hypothetical protein
MSYTPEELKRMKRNLGITDKYLKKLEKGSKIDLVKEGLDVFIYVYLNEYYAKSEVESMTMVNTADLTEFTTKCYDNFVDVESKRAVRFRRVNYGDNIHRNCEAFNDDKWLRFYSMMKAVYGSSNGMYGEARIIEDNTTHITVRFP